MEIFIRTEQESDYRTVEEITREAFWNLHVPGCDEHFFAHQLRKSPEFMQELDFVAVRNNEVIGNIMSSRSVIVSRDGNSYSVINTGPLCVHPDYQKQGVGTLLIKHTIEIAKKMGFRAIVLFGYPGYYNRFGFKSAKEYGISIEDGRFPVAHLILELYDGALDQIEGVFTGPEISSWKEREFDEFDAAFPSKEKKVTETQKLFAETSTSFL